MTSLIFSYNLFPMEEHGLTTSEALVWTFGELSGKGVPFPRDEAEFILMHVLHCKRSELFLNARRVLAKEEAQLLRSSVERRTEREPSQYIFGEAEFRGRAFKVTRDVLIPRPETELIVEEALKEAPSFGSGRIEVVDLCTGSGCIGVSAALELKDCEVFATDISGKALMVAEENATRLGASQKMRFAVGDLFAPLPESFKGRVDMVLSNPPYITEKDMASLEPEVREYEPAMALYGGQDGLEAIRRILHDAPEWLSPGGLILMEIGYDQKEAALMLADGSGRYDKTEIMKDYAGIGRIFKARTK